MLVLLMLFHLPIVLASARSHLNSNFWSLRAGADDLSDGEARMPVVDFRGADEGPPKRAVVLVDVFCPYHGCYLAESIMERYRDTAVVTVLSDYVYGYFQATNNQDEDWAALTIPSNFAKWKELPVEWTAVYCESDSGLSDAEALRRNLGVTCRDDPDVLPSRRDKYEMNEKCKKAGLLTANQKLCSSLDEAQSFASELWKESSSSPGFVIVKPRRGVASESVHLCSNPSQVEDAWKTITESNEFGTQTKHEAVLVQEYLEGQEYALDIVCRDGSYKVAAVWKYDKKSRGHQAPFVYYATKLIDTQDEHMEEICSYLERTLQTLGVKWGFVHGEVIITKSGPTLVEINCRQHNMDFLPLVMECIGYNGLDMTADALLGSNELWESYASRPRLKLQGQMVHLVNSARGKLSKLNHMEELNDLQSVLGWQVYPPFTEPGTELEPTTDIRTDAGWVQLVHEDKDRVDNDYEQIVKWMPTMFDIED